MANVIRIEAKWFPMLYAGLIQLGLLSCLFLAIRLHYGQVVQTHCNNWEFWPSVSSCTGDFMPERVVWRCAIALGGGPRIITALLQYYQFHSLLPSGRTWDINYALLCDCVRIFSAGIWTYVSSSEHLLIHEVAFVVYLLSGFICQTLQTLVAYRIHKLHPGKQNFHKAYRSKLMLYGLQIVFAVGVGVLFHRHRTYCYPGGYSLANMSEWAFSTCNVLYDYKGYLDLEGLSFTIALKGPEAAEGEHVGNRRYSFLSLSSWSRIFPLTTIPHMFKGYLFWMYVTWLPLQVYFLPMVKMGFTVHPIMFLLPTVLITWLAGGTRTREYLQSTDGNDKIFLLSLVGLLSFDIKLWPEAKLCAISVASSVIQVLIIAQLCNPDIKERYKTLSGLLTSLTLFVIVRMANLSLDPAMTSPHGNTLIFFIGLVMYLCMKFGKTPANDPPKILHSDDGPPTRSKSEGHYEGLTFGLLFSLTHMLCTEHGIPSRWVGVEVFPLGVIPTVMFVVGIVISVFVSQKSFIDVAKYYKIRAIVGFAASCVAVWGSSASVRMQESKENPYYWPIDYPAWHSAGYYGSPLISFIGAGVVLPAYCGSHWIPVVEASIMGLSGSSVCGHLRASLATFSLTYVIFIILTVYVVTFTFVPGGMLLRDRIWVLIVGLVAAIEVAWFKSDKSAVYLQSSVSTGTGTRQGFVSNIKRGIYLSLVLLVFVVAVRMVEEYDIEAELSGFEADTLKASIWTIHYGYDNEGNDNYNDIILGLKKQKSSVIGLLETDISRIATANRDLVEYAGNQLRMHTDYGPPTLDDTFGCAFLSKYPIINTTRYVMPSPQGELACLIHAKILVNKKTVNVYVGHFGNTEHVLDRRLQSETLGNLTLRNPEPSIFLGYLTTRPMSENYNLIMSSGWTDTGAALKNVPYSHPDPKTWSFPNGKTMNQDPRAPEVFGGRYCQYVLFKNLTMQWWGKTDAGHVSDTEIQTAWFDLP